MLKCLMAGLFSVGLFFSVSAFAAPTPDDELTNEMQAELESMDDAVALDDEDNQFLDDTKPSDGAIVWGKLQEPKKETETKSAKKPSAPQKSL